MASNGQISSEQLTRELLARANATQDSLGAFVTITEEPALAAARRADAELSRGEDKGPLHGIPLGIKDIIATSDAPTTANSRVLDLAWGHPPTDGRAQLAGGGATSAN
jgi:aspartyl-tRNA(Asn)/glutamyl-tRNA(Gln) amidotransferase subunit A